MEKDLSRSEAERLASDLDDNPVSPADLIGAMHRRVAGMTSKEIVAEAESAIAGLSENPMVSVGQEGDQRESGDFLTSIDDYKPAYSPTATTRLQIGSSIESGPRFFRGPTPAYGPDPVIEQLRRNFPPPGAQS